MANNPTLTNLRPPLFDKIVQTTGPQAGVPTEIEQKYRTNLNKVLIDIAPFDVKLYGALGNGTSDDTMAFQSAINAAISAGGGAVAIPNGTYSVNSLSIPAGAPPIFIIGNGPASVLKRRSDLAAGVGLFDIRASDVTLQDFLIDGGVTVSVGLQYSRDFIGIGGDDPMAPVLTKNTSVWLHGPANRLACTRLGIQHTGGYAILLDAFTGSINDVKIRDCLLRNNRPHLFGTVPGQLIYGSWTGGIYVNGDGRTVGSGTLDGLLVSECTFQRNTGNQIWNHLYGLAALHGDFRIVQCYLEDIGLDGVEIGGVSGGVVSGNIFHRIGYVCSDDTSPSVPRWGTLNATALDTSGLALGVTYTDNSFYSVNGGAIDGDGLGDSVIEGNLIRIPYAGEADYVEDQIAITGPHNSGSGSYGVNMGNTSQTPWGAQKVNISGNTFINLAGGSVRLYGARFCLVEDNLIDVPAVVVNPPIAMGPIGTGPYQRCYNNRVSHNHCSYSPGASAPLIKEDDSITVFLNTELNYCFGNEPIIGNSNAVEFVKSVNSGSTVFNTTIWFP